MKKICENQRKFDRFSLPVALTILELSDFPLVPEDVSPGGVMVIVPRKPETNPLLDCTMKIKGGTTINCQAQIAWERDNGTDPSSWSFGLKFELSEEKQKKLEGHIRDLFSEYGGEQSVPVSPNPIFARA